MCKIIAVANQKGGVAKTTTVVNLGAALVKSGKRVLLVDNDPQASLTICQGIDQPDELELTLVDLYDAAIRCSEDVDIRNCILHKDGIDFIPTDIGMCNSELSMINAMRREELLKRILSPIKSEYDYILIDCPPTLQLLNINSLTACDSVIIPVYLDFISIKGMELLLQSIAQTKRLLNPKLQIEGMLITRYEKTKLSKATEEIIRDAYGSNVRIFETRIPKSVRASESLGEAQDILKYDPRGKVADAYIKLANEVMSNV